MLNHNTTAETRATRCARAWHQATTCLRDHGGSVAIEFALCASLLLLLLLGSVEAARFMIFAQKLDRIASSVGDVTAKMTELNHSALTRAISLADPLAEPFALTNESVVIVSVLTPDRPIFDADPPHFEVKVLFQQSGGSGSATSRIGQPGDVADLPHPLGNRLITKQLVIATEVFHRYTPLLGTFVFPSGTIPLYSHTFHRTRVSPIVDTAS